MNTWYSQLVKPSWSPPAWLFGPVWTVLYLIIFITFGWVFLQAGKGSLPKEIIFPFILNLIFNLAFTPLQFGLRNNLLAAIDILFVLMTLAWMLVAIWPYQKLIVYFNIPYLLWVSFATFLQITITYLNLP